MELNSRAADLDVEPKTSETFHVFSSHCVKPATESGTVLLDDVGIPADVYAEEILAVVDREDLVAELATDSRQGRL